MHLRAAEAERQPLLPGSYATLPGLPAMEALTFACCLYTTLLEARDQTVVHGGNFRIAVNTTGIVVSIGSSRVVIAAALLERRWYRIAVAVGASVEVQIEGVSDTPSERPLRHRTTHEPSERLSVPRGDWELARERPGAGHFNGASKRCASTEPRSMPRPPARDSTHPPFPAGVERRMGFLARHRDERRNRRLRARPAARHVASDPNTCREGRALARRRVQLAREPIAIRSDPLSRRRPHRCRLASQHPVDDSRRSAPRAYTVKLTLGVAKTT